MSREKQNKGITGEKGTKGPPGVCPACRVYGPTISWDADTGVSTCTCGWSSEEGRDKQIEEMAEHLIDIQQDFNEYCAKPCRECELGGIVNCENHYKAKALYNAGYRKQSEDVTDINVGNKAVRGVPAADVVEVVRCKDCVHYEPHGNGKRGICRIPRCKGLRWDNNYCNYGERRE